MCEESIKLKLERTSDWKWLKDEEGQTVRYNGNFNVTTEYEHCHEDYKGWYSVIEFKDLEELMRFVKTHGDVVLTEHKIEIYDGYRE